MDEKKLGKKIQLARQERGFTQGQVEKRLGFLQKSMTRMESGQRLPSTLELAKLAELFHISIGDFLKSEPLNEDLLIVLHRMAPGLEKDSNIREQVNRCIHLCREGVSLEKLLEHPLDLEDSESKCKEASLQRQLRIYICSLVIEAYRQEKISRGRVIELSKLLNLPAQELLELVVLKN